MSNKTDLQGLNTDYAALIDTLRGKAVGGGSSSFEMCSVQIDVAEDMGSGTHVTDIMYTTTENGQLRNIEMNVSSDFSSESTGSSGAMTGSTFVRSATISCVVGTAIYMYDCNTAAPTLYTSSNISTSTFDDFGGHYKAVVNSGSTGRIGVDCEV